MRAWRIPPIAAGILGLILTGTAQAAIYKWVDTQGQVHFSDQPHGKTAKKLEIHNRVSPERQREAEKITKTYQRLDKQYDREKAAQRAKEREQARTKAQRRARCRELAKQANIANRYALVRLKQDGSPEYLSDKEVAAYKRKLRTLRQENCSGR